MSRRFWLLLLLAPLLAGCGAGLKEEGRVPISNPLGLSEGGTSEGGTLIMRIGTGGRQASATYRGSFSNTSTEINVSAVRRFIICQRIQSASVEVPEGATLPNTITLNRFHLNATFSDNQGSASIEVDVAGTVTLTRDTGNNYTVTIQGSGEDQCLVATHDGDNLNTLAQIVTQGGDNKVEVTLTANVSDPGLPDGSRIIFTTGLGTGTLEL